ncbi:MAG: DUF5615 family PIN-like protein [Phycisphaerales bacterium JB039]
MRFKLDENLPAAAAAVLRDAGFEVETVRDEDMEGAPDSDVIARCKTEGRCLVTLDAEFGNPLLYPPEEHRGIVLLRLPPRADRAVILRTIETLRDALMMDREANGMRLGLPGPDGRLWVIQPGRVRLYQGDQHEGD